MESIASAYCHVCDSEVAAIWNRPELQTNCEKTNYSDLSCNICGSNFVELLGQQLDAFLTEVRSPPSSLLPVSSSSSALSSSASSITDPSSISTGTSSTGSDPFAQILSRVLGMGVQTSPDGQSTLLDLLQHASSTSGGRPVGVVVRQAVSASDFRSISEALSASRTTIPTNGMQSPNIISPHDNEIRSMSNYLPRLREALGGPAGHSDAPWRSTGISNNSSLDEILHHILMNERSHAGIPPSSAETINSLNRIVVEADTDVSVFGECSISQEKFSIGDTVIMLQCGHNFKKDVIERWLGMHDTCPTCRIRVSEPIKS